MKPILFNTEMVRAIQNGTKTVTRRVLKTDKYIPDDAEFGYTAFTPKGCISCRGTFVDENDELFGESFIKLPYCKGDILYVRETWCESLGKKGVYYYRAYSEPRDEMKEFCRSFNKWRPSIHMPKEAARIFLRVTNIRVERLQDIDGYGVLAEGVDNGSSNPTMEKRWENMQCLAYSEIWNSTIKKSDLDKYGWGANPRVTVNEFERMSKEEAYEKENKA